MTCFGKLGVSQIQGSSGAAVAISAPATRRSVCTGDACTQRIQGGSSRTGGQSDQRRAAGRMVRIVGNRGAALQQLQTKIENRALTCIENVVPLASQI